MAQTIQALVSASVHQVIRDQYPDHYASLCHTHAIVGANLISIVFNRVYRPVAGMAVIDCGAGQHIRLCDESAFANPAGGAFHCWIESVDETVAEREVIDLTVNNNKLYAKKNGVPWRREDPPSFLWGRWSEVVVPGELDALPEFFGRGRIWLRETDEGWNFITRHLQENMNAYVTLTAMSIQELQRRLPKGSTLLEPLIHGVPDATDSGPTSVPVPVG